MTFATTLLRRHGGPAADSHPELTVLNGLLRRGVPIEPQERLVVPNGHSIRIDMAVRALRWAVEVDVHPWHPGSPEPSGVGSEGFSRTPGHRNPRNGAEET